MTLARPVDPARDHMWGRPDAPLTLVEYGDYQCPFCLKVSGAIEEVKEELGDRLRYVWRHAPLEREHPNAVAAAEAVEAAALQGKRTEFAKSLLADQDHQRPRTCCGAPRNWDSISNASSTISRLRRWR